MAVRPVVIHNTTTNTFDAIAGGDTIDPTALPISATAGNTTRLESDGLYTPAGSAITEATTPPATTTEATLPLIVFGTRANGLLGGPAEWGQVTVDGTAYLLPLYTNPGP